MKSGVVIWEVFGRSYGVMASASSFFASWSIRFRGIPDRISRISTGILSSLEILKNHTEKLS